MSKRNILSLTSNNNIACLCLPGYTGKKCGRGINECQPNPCQNGATCEDLINGYQCHCTTGFRGDQCQISLDVNYQLDFAAPGIVDSAQFKFPDTPLNSITVTFWMKSDDVLNYGTPFSYAVPGSDNTFTLTDYNGFVIFVNQEKRVTDLVANDGQWHHIVVTWSSNRGAWKIYQDGLIIDSGWDLSTGNPVPGGGMFVIGQEQDEVGGQFSSSESFVGSLTHLNVWDEEIPLSTIDDMRITCNKYLGDVLAWPDVYKGLRGTLSDSPSTFCQDCPLPSKPDFGSVDYTDVTAGSSARYSCLRGFNVAGMNDQLCLATGNWEEEPPVCVKVECGFPGNIQNGYTEGRRYSFDNRVRYHCHKGYELVGSKTRYCNEYGEWEGDKPRCVEISCELPLLSVNTLVINPKDKYVPRDTVRFECTPGNVMFTTHDSVRCQSDGTWDKSVPTCDAQTCSTAPKIDYGGPINELDEYSVGGQVSYDCNFGYELSPTASNSKGKLTCLPSGDWSTDLPVCKIVTCPDVPMVAHSNSSGNNNEFLSIVQYECHAGYEMVGDDTIECYEDGEWTPDPPECRPVNCGEPTAIDHGSIQGSSYELNNIITYQCDAGYRLNDEPRRTCLGTGFWSGNERECNPVTCPQPNPILNGQIQFDRITFQSSINYTCDEGYELFGINQRSCLETGQWSLSDPDCLPVNCGTPPNLPNGNFKGMPPYVFGTTVYYYCNDGYEILDNTNLTCESSGQWSDAVPLCLQITCPPPQAPQNGYVNPLGLTYTSKAEYECSDGFILEGVSSRTCQIDRTWTDSLPTCKPTQCQPPDQILNGRIEYKDLSIGAIVKHTCDLAHELVGDEIRRCTDNLTWSGQSVQCIPVQCPQSLLLTNGRVEISGTSFGSVASYICDSGYELVGDEERVCTELGNWSSSNSSCEIVECDPSATEIQNGIVIGSTYTYGSVVRYECNEGYIMLGQDIRQCKSDGEWNVSKPVCQVVQCPSYTLDNGFVDGFERDYNSVVNYTCNENFRLEGPSSRRCLSGGVWSGDDPVCIKIVCPEITSIDFGTFVTIDSRNVRYDCLEGYNLIGPRERFCQENGTWSSTDPYCEIVSCPDLTNTNISNGSVIQNGNTFGSRVNYLCDDGFELVGTTEALCLANGSWSYSLPVCSVISCGEPGSVLNGLINGDIYTYGAILNYTCLVGFRLIGVGQRQCGKSGQWEPNSPRCEQITCPDLDDIEDGSVTILSNTYGGSAVYNCNSGYDIVGLAERECLAGGQWEDFSPVCAPIVCNQPHALNNGQIIGTNYRFEKEITYQCDEGYRLDGDSVRKCQANGRWSGKKPVCQIIRCEDPRRFEHGIIVGDTYTYNHTLTYLCDDGYNLIGEASRRCTINWVWSSPAPQCERLSCTQLPTVSNANIHGNQTLFNTSRFIECQQGYTPIGDPIITCLANASWSTPNLRCEIIQCPPITSIQQGAVLGTSYDYESEIYFTCNIGYDLQGAETLKCMANGSWDNILPYCTVVSCPEVTPPQHGNVNSTTGVYGDVLKYKCLRGFELIGSTVIRCLDYGDWDIPPPYCQIISCPSLPASITHGRSLSVFSNYTYNTTVEYICERGYEMIGNSILKCAESRMWDNTIPYCVKINCPPPGGLLYGQVLGTEDQIEYMCNPGYRLIGSRERKCTDSGQWDAEAPFCVAVVCPTPTPIPNGNFLGDNFTYDFQIEYMCDIGYEIVGNYDRTCLEDGSWDNPAPVCSIISCGSPPFLPDGIIIGNNYTFGQTIQYVCNDGYTLTGIQERRCEETGSWSSGRTICERVACPLPRVQNGFIQNPGTSFYAGTSITIECFPNYRLEGSSIVTCLDNGSLSPINLPLCIIITCPAISNLPNGRVIGSDFRAGQQLEFLCDLSHELIGENILMCLADGRWNHDPPVCQENLCPQPRPISHGRYISSRNSDEYKINDRITAQCDDGYEILGERQLLCKSDSTWSFEFPSCVPVDCGPPKNVPNAQLIGSNFKFMDQVTYVCNDGYQLEGLNQLECGDDGSWVGSYPRCAALCRDPPDLPNASYILITTRGTRKTARYTCDYGYILSGDAEATCSSGQWMLDNRLSCLQITCVDPPIVNNAKYQLRERTIGSGVTYSCNLGYVMVGPSQLLCQETGEWEGLIPRCEPIYCGPPPDSQPYIGNDFTFGREVQYVCDVGYSVVGDPNLICQANGEWSASEPPCIRNSCGPLPIPLHGRVVTGDPALTTFYNDTIVFECNDNYTIEGQNEVRCMADSRWSNSPPVCLQPSSIVNFCEKRVEVENSVAFQANYIPGESATVICKNGYQPQGDMTTTCNQDTTWAVPSGRCERVFCGRPRVADTVNVVLMGFSYYYEDQVQYMCRPGLHPIKFPPILTCQADGQWDGEAKCAATCKLPCHNGGMCVGLNRCKCRPGYGGYQCEIPVCILPCLNKGKCVAPYTCSCPEGYTGPRCEQAVCQTPCENGGRCIGPDTCLCFNGYQTPYCKSRKKIPARKPSR